MAAVCCPNRQNKAQQSHLTQTNYPQFANNVIMTEGLLAASMLLETVAQQRVTAAAAVTLHLFPTALQKETTLPAEEAGRGERDSSSTPVPLPDQHTCRSGDKTTSSHFDVMEVHNK